MKTTYARGGSHDGGSSAQPRAAGALLLCCRGTPQHRPLLLLYNATGGRKAAWLTDLGGRINCSRSSFSSFRQHTGGRTPPQLPPGTAPRQTSVASPEDPTACAARELWEESWGFWGLPQALQIAAALEKKAKTERSRQQRDSESHAKQQLQQRQRDAAAEQQPQKVPEHQQSRWEPTAAQQPQATQQQHSLSVLQQRQPQKQQEALGKGSDTQTEEGAEEGGWCHQEAEAAPAVRLIASWPVVWSWQGVYCCFVTDMPFLLSPLYMNLRGEEGEGKERNRRYVFVDPQVLLRAHSASRSHACDVGSALPVHRRLDRWELRHALHAAVAYALREASPPAAGTPTGRKAAAGAGGGAAASGSDRGEICGKGGATSSCGVAAATTPAAAEKGGEDESAGMTTTYEEWGGSNSNSKRAAALLQQLLPTTARILESAAALEVYLCYHVWGLLLRLNALHQHQATYSPRGSVLPSDEALSVCISRRNSYYCFDAAAAANSAAASPPPAAPAVATTPQAAVAAAGAAATAADAAAQTTRAAGLPTAHAAACGGGGAAAAPTVERMAVREGRRMLDKPVAADLAGVGDCRDSLDWAEIEEDEETFSWRKVQEQLKHIPAAPLFRGRDGAAATLVQTEAWTAASLVWVEDPLFLEFLANTPSAMQRKSVLTPQSCAGQSLAQAMSSSEPYGSACFPPLEHGRLGDSEENNGSAGDPEEQQSQPPSLRQKLGTSTGEVFLFYKKAAEDQGRLRNAELLTSAEVRALKVDFAVLACRAVTPTGLAVGAPRAFLRHPSYPVATLGTLVHDLQVLEGFEVDFSSSPRQGRRELPGRLNSGGAVSQKLTDAQAVAWGYPASEAGTTLWNLDTRCMAEWFSTSAWAAAARTLSYCIKRSHGLICLQKNGVWVDMIATPTRLLEARGCTYSTRCTVACGKVYSDKY